MTFVRATAAAMIVVVAAGGSPQCVPHPVCPGPGALLTHGSLALPTRVLPLRVPMHVHTYNYAGTLSSVLTLGYVN